MFGSKMASKLEMSTRRLLFFNLEFAAFSLCLGWWQMRQNTCAEIHSYSSTAAQRRSFSVLVNSAPGLNLKFDLILVDEKVNRIITYVNHPSAIYFENPNSLGLSSIQLEAASNFILWLLGKPHDPTIIQRRNAGMSFNKIIAAPISDMRRYMSLEKKDQRILHHSEYLDQFLSWARRYLGDEYDMAVRDERSIAGACAEKMNRRAWTARIQKFLAEHKFGTTGRSVTDRCSTEHAARLRDEEVDQYNDKDPPSVRYSKDAVTSVPQPRTDFSVTECKLMQRRINQVVTENRAYRPKSEEQELWEGRQVKMYSNGTISMRVPWRKRPLSLVVSPQARKNIKRFRVSPTIHFLPESVKLQTGQEVLFSRSTIFMRNAQDGEDWEWQIRKELGAKGYLGLGQELWEPGLAPRTESDCMQATQLSRRAGYNADHRMKLLKGDHFYCGERDDKYGRVTLRGPLFVLVPRHAYFTTVWIHCDLLEKGMEHPETCAKNALDGDPAKRLGIELRFNSEESSIVEEIWIKMATDSDTKKLNSLVDFLDGADEEYTAKQPRRFLAQKKGKNGRPASYT